MKQSILFLCLIAVFIMYLPVLAQEDMEKMREAAIIEGATDFYNCYAAKDIEGMLKWVSPYSTQLITELRNEVKNIQNINEFSCGNLKLLRYKNNPDILKIEITFECEGFNPETSKEFKQEIAKQVRFVRDDDGAWKISEMRDFDVNVDKENRPFFEE